MGLRVGLSAIGLVALLGVHGQASTLHLPAGAPALKTATAEEILARVREPGSSVTVVNVWATWCTPCRREFPDLMRVYRDHRGCGLRLVLVSADFPDRAEAARRFLTRQGVDFPTYLKSGKDMDFIQALDARWSGSLPATFVYDARGVLRSFHEGRTTGVALESLIVAVTNGRDPQAKETVR